MNRLLKLLSVSSCVLGLSLTYAHADDSSDDDMTTSPEIEALKENKEKLDLEVAIAQQEKALQDAKYPKSDIALKAGDVTVDDKAGYYATVLAYESLDKAGEDIAEKVHESLSFNTISVEGEIRIFLEQILQEKPLNRHKEEDIIKEARKSLDAHNLDQITQSTVEAVSELSRTLADKDPKDYIIKVISEILSNQGNILLVNDLDTSIQYSTYKLIDKRLGEFGTKFIEVDNLFIELEADKETLLADKEKLLARKERLLLTIAPLDKITNLEEQQIQEISVEITEINSEISNNAKAAESVIAAATTAISLLGSAAEIAAFFKQDLDIKGRDIEIAQSSLRTVVAKHLIERGRTPQYPEFELISKQGSGDNIQSKLFDTITNASALTDKLNKFYSSSYKKALDKYSVNLSKIKIYQEQRKRAVEVNNTVRVIELDASISELQNENINMDYKKKNDDWKRFSNPINQLLTEFKKYSEELLKTDTADNKSPIEQLALVEAIYESNSHILYLNVLSSGGELRIKESLWRSAINHIGSVTCEFLLVDSAQKLLEAGILTKSKYDKDFSKHNDLEKFELRRPRR